LGGTHHLARIVIRKLETEAKRSHRRDVIQPGAYVNDRWVPRSTVTTASAITAHAYVPFCAGPLLPTFCRVDGARVAAVRCNPQHRVARASLCSSAGAGGSVCTCCCA
jgi:hypothetical protein